MSKNFDNIETIFESGLLEHLEVVAHVAQQLEIIVDIAELKGGG